MQVESLDHLVLTVANLERTLAFYTRVLGMHPLSSGQGRHALALGDQKINLHLAGQEFDPKALRPTPGSADLCLITRSPLSRLLAHLGACGVEVIEGPVPRTGARGPMISVYLRDPDGNLLEVASYEEAKSLAVDETEGRGGRSA